MAIPHVPDQVAARLEKLASQAGLMDALPSLPIEHASILDAMGMLWAESRAEH